MRFFATTLLAALLTVACFQATGDALQSGDDPFETPSFLGVDQAFVLSSTIVQGRLVARWQVAEGYYLYRHAFALEAAQGITLGALDIPRGQRIVDDYFGESEVYHDSVAIGADIEISNANEANDSTDEAATVAVLVRYQGCAAHGLCYPPQKRVVTIEVARSGPEPIRIVP